MYRKCNDNFAPWVKRPLWQQKYTSLIHETNLTMEKKTKKLKKLKTKKHLTAIFKRTMSIQTPINDVVSHDKQDFVMMVLLPSACHVIGGSCYNYCFCRDKHVFGTTVHIFCRDKSMLLMTKVLLRQIFVATNTILSRQNLCRNKHVFVATKHIFCHDKNTIVAINVLSRQTRVCRDKSFVATIILLSRQKTCFVMTNTFVASAKCGLLCLVVNCTDSIKVILCRSMLCRIVFCLTDFMFSVYFGLKKIIFVHFVYMV